jgi:hypothetical protein
VGERRTKPRVKWKKLKGNAEKDEKRRKRALKFVSTET